MGLDIYHAQAKREVDKRFFRVETASYELKPLQPYFQIHENPHIDWDKMFADRGLVYQSHRVLCHATDGRRRCVAFVDAEAAGLDHPVRVVFSDERKFPLLPKFMQRSKFRIPQAKKAPHFFGPFETIMKSETVIFYDLVGYQQPMAALPAGGTRTLASAGLRGAPFVALQQARVAPL